MLFIIVFCFLYLCACFEFEKAGEKYVTLLFQKPLDMDSIEQMEDETLKEALPEAKIESFMQPFETLEEILYSEIIEKTSTMNKVGVAARCVYEMDNMTFHFNLLFSVGISTDTNLVSSILFKYNWTAPSYANPSLFYEEPTTVGPLELDGMLTIPRGNDVDPHLDGVVLLVGGSGGGDMDETIYGCKPFKDLSWGLASQNIAVLRYNKRTHSHSIGTNGTYVEEYVIDAESAIDALFDRFQVPVTVVAHSEGGKVSPLICYEKEDKCNAVVNVAGEIEHLVHGMHRQIRYIMLLLGNGTITPEEQSYLDAIQEVEDLLEKGELPLNYSMPPPLQGHVYPEYLITLYDLDPAYYANSMKKPIHLINGATDYQVDLINNFDIWKKELRNNPLASFKEFLYLDHILKYYHGVPSPLEYQTPQNVYVGVIEEIQTFIKQLKQ